MIYFILGFIVFIYIIRKSNTSDLLKQANMTTQEQEDAFEEAVLNIKSTRASCIALAICLISLIIVALIRHTSIELFFMNYFGDQLYRKEIETPLYWYGIPFFSIIIRGIIVQVSIGDYLKRNYNLEEIEINLKEETKKLLLKPKQNKNTTENENIIEELDLTSTNDIQNTEIATPVTTTNPETLEPINQVTENINNQNIL